MPDRLTNSEIAAVNARLVDVIGRRVDLRRRGREHVGLCPFHKENTPSFTVVPAKGFYFCFGCGVHGDAIGFVRAIDNLSFADAVEAVQGQSSAVSHKPLANSKKLTAKSRREAASRLDWCRTLWRSCRPAAGTLVETYLRARGLDPVRLGGIPPTLRFHPACLHSDTGLHLPAMVAAVQAPNGRFLTVHRTYLARDGAGKAVVVNPKKIGSACVGGAVRLAPLPAGGTVGPRVGGVALGLAEGIETALSVMMVCPELPVWSALSLGNLAGPGVGRGRPHPDDRTRRLPSTVPAMGGIDLPRRVSTVILIADADGKDRAVGEALLARAAAKFHERGLKVNIARPRDGMDFNDMLMAT